MDCGGSLRRNLKNSVEREREREEQNSSYSRLDQSQERGLKSNIKKKKTRGMHVSVSCNYFHLGIPRQEHSGKNKFGLLTCNKGGNTERKKKSIIRIKLLILLDFSVTSLYYFQDY